MANNIPRGFTLAGMGRGQGAIIGVNGTATMNAGVQTAHAVLPAGSAEAANVAAVLGAAPVAIVPPPGAANPNTNLLPFVPVTQAMLQDFIGWCAPRPGVAAIATSPAVERNVLAVVDAYIRQICVFVNSARPDVSHWLADPTAAYLPSDFWQPGANPVPAAYIANRSAWLNANSLFPQYIEELTFLFIHIAQDRYPPVNTPHSSLIVINMKACTIEWLDSQDNGNTNAEQQYIIGDILNLLCEHIPGFEIADWKKRTDDSKQNTTAHHSSQVWTCTNAMSVALGYKTKADNPPGVAYPVLMNRRARVIVADLFRGSFSNIIGAPGYKPRVKYDYDIAHRQPRGGSAFRDLAIKLQLKRLKLEYAARWNANNRYRYMNALTLIPTVIQANAASRRKYRGYTTQAGGRSIAKLRAWVELCDLKTGPRVTLAQLR